MSRKRIFQVEHSHLLEMTVLDSPEEQEVLLCLFETIAEEEGWQPGEQLRAFASHALHFAARHQGQLLGGIQLVLGERTPHLPCSAVWPELCNPDPSKNAHIALLALHSHHRGDPLLFWRLGIAMWQACQERGIITLWAEVTPARLRLYHRLGWPFHIVGPLRSHWGEDCFLCTLCVAELTETVTHKADCSPRYQRILAYTQVQTDVVGQEPPGEISEAALA